MLEALYPLLLRQGTPEYIRSDNGPEFVARAMQDWLAKVGIKSIRIYLGSPLQNRYRPGRTDITNDTIKRCSAKVSTPDGSQRRSKPRSSSISGSDSKTTSGQIRP